MIIVGEIYNNFVKICLLERKSDTWEYRGKSYFVPALTPIFFDVSLNSEEPGGRTTFEFISTSGITRKGSVSNTISNCYVVACNNRHVFVSNTIWNKIEENPVDMICHLGDQTYCDTLFWKWFYALDKSNRFDTYKEDIEKDYYTEYLDTWEPLENTLSHTSSIMIPDDHEARSRADIWTDGIKESVTNQMNENLKYYLIDEKKTAKMKLKEDFLFKVAFDLCRGLYLGLRYTNKEQFDYFRKYDDITIILTERISQSLFSKTFHKHVNKLELKFQDKVIIGSGLPPMPIRENFGEMMIYRHPSTIPDSVYDKFCSKFKDTNFIAVGGDIHLGSSGDIYSKKLKREIGKFHTVGPSSGFTSFHIPQDCLGSTSKYEFRVKEFNNRDPNALYIDLINFESKMIYEKADYSSSVLNLANTGGTFWKPGEDAQ